MTRLTAHAYTVAWLCALPLIELVAATAMLDEEHDPLSLPIHDDNTYIYGSINGHNVVVACLPPGQPGKVSASKLVQPLNQSFPNLKIHLFVGIGGGVPVIPPPDNPEKDIHLGDVVIGWAEQTGVPGVVQWDLVRYLEDGNIEPLSTLDKPDRRLLNALSIVLRNRILRRTRFSEHLDRLQQIPGFSHPGLEDDILFKSTYHHAGGPNCSSCDRAQLTERLPRINQNLIFHQGTIVSGDTVMKNPQRRDEVSRIYHGALCFEMEAAGVMDDKRCLIIRGIADYADSHKNGSWQNYAAGTAAAFAREFLFTLQPQIVSGMESATSLDTIPTGLTEDEKACLQSLSFPEMDFRKNDVEDPIDKTCAWILNHSIYLHWLQEHRGLLWLKGKPGAGKSTLMRYALKQQKDQDMLIVASFFFHGRGAPIQKSLLGFFRSLLFQILQHIPGLLSSFSGLFKRKRDTQGTVDKDWKWQASELQGLFKLYITNAIKTHCVQIFVDALDECGEETATYLVDFLQRLIDELPRTQASLRICFSCRHYPLVALEYGLEICVEDENQDDIQIYIRHKLEAGIRNKTLSEKLQENILQRSLNVFQWVVLVVPHVILLFKKGKSPLSIQKVLGKIPTKLNELYEELLHGIDDNEKPQSLQLMQWICFALRPLSLRELRFALALNNAQTPHDSLAKCKAAEEFAETDEEMEKKVNDLSKGLAEVKTQSQEQVAQFVHQSVRDYLIQDGLNVLTNSTVPGDVVGSAHFRLSRSCIQYMTMKEIEGFSMPFQTPGMWTLQEEWTSVEVELPFIRYAVTSWIAHAKEAEKRHISQVDLFDFISQSSGDALQGWIRLHNIFSRNSGSEIRPGQTPLHIASILGFCGVVSAILDTDDSGLNSEASYGYGRATALSMAVANGNEAVVKLLLAQREILPNLAIVDGTTPLHIAVENDHVETLKLLLARKDVNTNSKGCFENTPLHLAVNRGKIKTIVKLPLARNVLNPNPQNDYKIPPLYELTNHKQFEIIKLLLARKDLNPNLKNFSGHTPLQIAAIRGNLEIVELLLERNDIEIEPRHYRLGLLATPLEAAKQNGHEEIVKLLEARLRQQQAEID